MDVVLIKNYDDILIGSVIQDITEIDGCYVGLWCSSYGSYEVEVPIQYCEIRKNGKTKTLLQTFFSK